MIPSGIVSEVYYAMLDTPYFMPDDAWLGVIWEKLNINIIDTHTHFSGISSYRKELRIVKLFTSGRFDEMEILATILDYAYDHDDIPTKLIEVWFAFKSKQKQISSQVYAWVIDEYWIICFMILMIISCVTCCLKTRNYRCLVATGGF